MNESPHIASQLDRAPLHINVVLFSQPECEFCLEVRERYLKPLAASAGPGLNVAEASIAERKPMRDWRGQAVAEAEFARTTGARFAPTVMFLDGAGHPLAEPIVGLSRDYFGAYLEQRLAHAAIAVRRRTG